MIWQRNIHEISRPGAQNFAVCVGNNRKRRICIFRFNLFFPVGLEIGVLKDPADMEKS
jgi:hypothetical protein